MGRAAEAVATALAGAALGTATGVVATRRLHVSARLATVGVAVAAANGFLGGRRAVYDRRSVAGIAAFVLDSTWALTTTASGVVAHLVGLVQGERAGYVRDLSERRGRVVYRRGLVVRPGFAITLGNVVNGAGDVDRPRRRRLVTDHEDLHVWQARWFGPIYPLAYACWLLGGGIGGALVWAAGRSPASLPRTVETCAYYLNPFEWWAYSRDGNWPPPGAVPELVWRRPAVGPLEEVRVRADRAGRAAPR